jgi:hypothetical protein
VLWIPFWTLLGTHYERSPPGLLGSSLSGFMVFASHHPMFGADQKLEVPDTGPLFLLLRLGNLNNGTGGRDKALRKWAIVSQRNWRKNITHLVLEHLKYVFLHLSISAFPSGLNEVRKIVLRGLLLQTPTLQEYPLLLISKHLFWKAVNRMRETQETAPIPNSGLVLGIPLVMRWCTKMTLRLWLVAGMVAMPFGLPHQNALLINTKTYEYIICNIIYI